MKPMIETHCNVCGREIPEDEIVSSENIAKIKGAVAGKKYQPYILKKQGEDVINMCQNCWPDTITEKHLIELE